MKQRRREEENVGWKGEVLGGKYYQVCYTIAMASATTEAAIGENETVEGDSPSRPSHAGCTRCRDVQRRGK